MCAGVARRRKWPGRRREGASVRVRVRGGVADGHSADAAAQRLASSPTPHSLLPVISYTSHTLYAPSGILTMSDQQPPADSNAAAGPSTGAAANNSEEQQPLLAPGDPAKEQALKAFKKALKSHEDLSGGLKRCEWQNAGG